jgi:protein-S-isoprenylcysteine O-methyltransferase Ste14
MRRWQAAVGSVVFFAVAPGVVVGLVPWWLTGWAARDPMPYGWPVRVIGLVLLVAGVAVLLAAFARFVREGIGTPAPVAPTQHLVVRGLYRHVRNPMYLAVWAGILGQAVLLAQPSLVWWLLFVVVATASFVKLYEEPTLRRQFPDEYDAYVASVPGWIPSFRSRDSGRGTDHQR